MSVPSSCSLLEHRQTIPIPPASYPPYLFFSEDSPAGRGSLGFPSQHRTLAQVCATVADFAVERTLSAAAETRAWYW